MEFCWNSFTDDGVKEAVGPKGKQFPKNNFQLTRVTTELLKLRDEEGEKRMWEVIQGVWVEMLCFSAGRYLGYFRAKSLGVDDQNWQ